MLEMCRIAGNRDQLLNLLLVLAENVANIILVHFQDGYASYYLRFIMVKLFVLLMEVSSAVPIYPTP